MRLCSDVPTVASQSVGHFQATMLIDLSGCLLENIASILVFGHTLLFSEVSAALAVEERLLAMHPLGV